jgi:hypothetical protein
VIGEAAGIAQVLQPPEDDRMRQIVCIVALGVLAGASAETMAGDKGTTINLDGLKSTAPPNWKAQPIDVKKVGTFRKYHFAIPKVDGDKEDAELLILNVGGGGNNEANIKRWKMMFAPPPDKNIDDVSKVDSFKVGEVPVVYVDIRGTYLYKFPPFAADGKVTPKENFRFLGAIFDSKDGPYYIRLTGPARTVEASKKGFDDWLKGFK